MRCFPFYPFLPWPQRASSPALALNVDQVDGYSCSGVLGRMLARRAGDVFALGIPMNPLQYHRDYSTVLADRYSPRGPRGCTMSMRGARVVEDGQNSLGKRTGSLHSARGCRRVVQVACKDDGRLHGLRADHIRDR